MSSSQYGGYTNDSVVVHHNKGVAGLIMGNNYIGAVAIPKSMVVFGYRANGFLTIVGMASHSNKDHDDASRQWISVACLLMTKVNGVAKVHKAHDDGFWRDDYLADNDGDDKQ